MSEIGTNVGEQSGPGSSVPAARQLLNPRTTAGDASALRLFVSRAKYR